eukprot:365219-Chlamydomonas_euryale.AAC.21
MQQELRARYHAFRFHLYIALARCPPHHRGVYHARQRRGDGLYRAAAVEEWSVGERHDGVPCAANDAQH